MVQFMMRDWNWPVFVQIGRFATHMHRVKRYLIVLALIMVMTSDFP
jgi:hypothetical protein